ncbi:membrane protein [Acrocarpospora corrugata]|uniref:Membrane protein n=1 Tax=Acrocarpospora corrugata TaxID=35763 RepID=A0A5M3VXF6_9ACTN|nr:hypothetical protein [Acrocarpospora corrugata]GES00640.1 membrane protein [Acrocarpospora corrugata]
MTELSIRTASLPARLIRLYSGLALYGAGIGLQVESTLGNDPWDVFHQGLAVRTGWTIGTWIIVVGALVMVFWIPLRQKPGVGTISNVLLLGLFADATIWLAPTPGDLALRWLFLVAAIVSVAFATALYIGAGMGPGPRDGLMTGLARLGLSIRLARTLIEVTVLIAGWLLGGTVGIGTLAFAAAIGPLTQLFMRLQRVA